MVSESKHQYDVHRMVLNGETLRQILSDMGDDAQELLDASNESLWDYLRLIRDRDDTTTQEDLTRFVHSMKSIAGSLGGEEVYQLAADYEAGLRAEQYVDLERMADELDRACSQLFDAIEQTGLVAFKR